jgi:glucokinase
MTPAIGVDIGGTRIRAARVSSTGAIEAHVSETTAKQPSAILAQIDTVIAAVDQPSVATIGIGVPSRVDFKTAEVFPGGFVDLSGPPLASRLASVQGRPVFTDNDGTMALVAEARLGAARGTADVVMLTIGTGIGGAAMLSGKVLHGKATAGQLGHLTIDHAGLVCPCGRRGCLETESSGTALGRHIAEAGLPVDTKAEDLLQRDDPVSLAVLGRWMRPLRAGIDSLVATLDPEVIVLGGGLGQAACTALARFPAPSSWFQCRVVPAVLGSEAGVIGAALAALERLP